MMVYANFSATKQDPRSFVPLTKIAHRKREDKMRDMNILDRIEPRNHTSRGGKITAGKYMSFEYTIH